LKVDLDVFVGEYVAEAGGRRKLICELGVEQPRLGSQPERISVGRRSATESSSSDVTVDRHGEIYQLGQDPLHRMPRHAVLVQFVGSDPADAAQVIQQVLH